MKYNLLGAVSTVAMGAVAGFAFSSAQASPVFLTTPVTQSVIVGSTTGLPGNGTFTFSGFTAPVIPGANVHFHDVDLTITLVREILSDTGKITSNAASRSVGLTFNPSGSAMTAHSTLTLSGLGGVAGLFAAVSTLTTPGFSGTITQAAVKTTVGTTLVGPVTLVSTQLLSGLSPFLSSWSGKLNFSGGQGGSVPGDVLTGNDGSASITAVLTYSYTTSATTVPEPATLAVLGLGLAGLGAIRRRRGKA